MDKKEILQIAIERKMAENEVRAKIETSIREKQTYVKICLEGSTCPDCGFRIDLEPELFGRWRDGVGFFCLSCKCPSCGRECVLTPYPWFNT